MANCNAAQCKPLCNPIQNGYDTTFQVEVKDWRIQPCGHHHTSNEVPIACNSFQLAGLDIRTLIQHKH